MEKYHTTTEDPNKRKINIPCVHEGEQGIEKCFWEELDKALRGILHTKKIFINGDFDGHIRETPFILVIYVYGGFGLGIEMEVEHYFWILVKLLHR